MKSNNYKDQRRGNARSFMVTEEESTHKTLRSVKRAVMK